MAKRSTYGLDLHRLGKLLSLGTDDAVSQKQDGEHMDIASFLKNTMTCPLFSASSSLESLLTMLDQADLYEPNSKKSLCNIFLDKSSNVQLFQILKAFGKQLSYTSVDENQKALGATVYHAAIAAAVLFHDDRISRSSNEKLADSFEMLKDKEWMLSELIELFSQAEKVCRQKGHFDE